MNKIIYTLALIFFTNAVINAQSTVLSGGNNESVGLCGTSGTIYAWGDNSVGQIGQGTLGGTYNTPQKVIFTGAGATRNFVQANGGSGAHAVALDCKGNVWAWGDDNYGQTGGGGAITCNGSATSATPVEVVTGAQGDASGFLSNVVLVGAGNNFSYAIDKTGQVYTWGQNDHGELGNGTSGTGACSSSPVKVTKCASAGGGNLTNIIQVQGGDETGYALDNSGHVWAWGLNNNNNIGNGNTTDQACATEVLKAAGTILTGIKMIAGGDTHGLALDSSGYVWSWGGNWGAGQIGQGIPAGGAGAPYAGRVVAPNNYTATPSSGPWVQGVYIAAGQASSVVVLTNGMVVSFGALGLYGTPGEGNNGTLGNGVTPTAGTISGSACPATTYSAPYTYTGASCTGYSVPTYVLTAANTPLKGIASVARGDAWYFAIDSSGTIYNWGANSNGQLGIGNTTDQGYANHTTSFTCAVATPCPTKPGLGPDTKICPTTSTTLNADENYSGYTYTWYSSTALAGPYTIVQAASSAATASKYALTMPSVTTYYMVKVDYNGTCGACTSEYDTIKLTPILPTFTGSGTYCTSGGDITDAQFTISGSTDGFKWYTAATGGTYVGSGLSIKVPKTSTNTSYNSGGTCPYALFAQDTSTYNGSLMPTLTAANDPGIACGGASGNDNGTGVSGGDYTMIVVTSAVTINSVQFTQTNTGYSGTFSFAIYDNSGAATWCGVCGSGANYAGTPGTKLYSSTPQSFTVGSPTVQTLTGSYTLAPGTYWIGINSTSGSWLEYTCQPAFAAGTSTWSTPYWDNTGFDVVKAVSSYRYGAWQAAGALFNIQFSVGAPYTCSRLLVCATLGSCPTPVKFLAFTAQQQNSSVLLDWSTATEKNSSYYDVERSTDGVNFTSIGKVNAAGNSNTIRNYNYTDNTATELSGTIYYRIVEYDINGETTVSTIEAVNTGKGSDVKIIPNPNNGSFTVLVEGEQQELQLTLFNTVGIVIYEGSGKAEGSVFEQNINIHNMPAGVYFLNVHSPSSSWVKKIVKE